MPDYLIKKALIVLPDKKIVGDLLIENHIIAAIAPNVSATSAELIDGENKVVMPGVIDTHVHFREPGLTHKEDFYSGTKSAIAGGVTTVLDMPNVIPPTVSIQALNERRELASKKCLCNYGFHFGATVDNLEVCREVSNVPSIKVFLGSSTGNMLINNKKVLNSLFELRKLLTIHAEDENLIREIALHYDSPDSATYHPLLRPPECAILACKKAIKLAEKHRTKIHICHLSTAEEFRLVQNSNFTTFEVAPHHLYFNEEDIANHGNYLKMNPPLRPESDRQFLHKMLSSGMIDILATDHAPHLREEKERDYLNAPAGVPGVQHLLLLMLEEVYQERLGYSRMVKMLSEKPADIFAIQNKGKLQIGYDADIVLINHQKNFYIEKNNIYSKCGWSPYLHRRIHGLVEKTWVNGKIVYDEGLFYEHFGQEILIKE